MTDNIQSNPSPNESGGANQSSDSGRQAGGNSSSFLLPLVVVIILALVGVVAYATISNSQGTLGAFNLSAVTSSQEPVAIVNGEQISRSEYQQNLEQAQQSIPSQATGTQAEQMQAQVQEQVITNLVNRTLVLQAATEAGISVESSAIDAQVDQYRQQLGGEEQLNSQLESAGMSMDDLRSNIREQLLIQQYIQQESDEGALAVSDQEIQDFYNQVSSGNSGQQVPPLEQVRGQIQGQLEQQKQQQALQGIIQELRADAEIEILI